MVFLMAKAAWCRQGVFLSVSTMIEVGSSAAREVWKAEFRQKLNALNGRLQLKGTDTIEVELTESPLFALDHLFDAYSTQRFTPAELIARVERIYAATLL